LAERANLLLKCRYTRLSAAELFDWQFTFAGLSLSTTCFTGRKPLPERRHDDFLERVRKGFGACEPAVHYESGIAILLV